ncbi:hypothetical protein C1645_836591 [Glomus cerebriforme]|uniref:Uncharacterized protein n=1 Tax=Glomus cerebriforme TaxID=658196 RepID=A0A397SGX3_9GLOM|nr:hypothetical protein C1645_836591 [Glomus cerebriforme]
MELCPEVLRGNPYTQAADIYSFENEIEKQFEEAEKYFQENLLSIEHNQQTETHSQAVYTSRLKIENKNENVKKC